MKKCVMTIIVVTIVTAAFGGSVRAQDVDNGKKIFMKLCIACHYPPNDERNWFGPSLHGIVNRRSAQYKDYSYSAAMKNSNIIWTEENLDKFIKSPDITVPGTKMDCVGISTPKDRADIISYLNDNVN